MPRVPDAYVWLAWAGAFAAAWAGMYAAFPRLRSVLLWVGLCTTPFGLTEPLFAGVYWNPPSLFHLARTIHFDLESFPFCFAIGGTAAVLYDVAGGTTPRIPIRDRSPVRPQQTYVLALVCPAIVFTPLLIATARPMWAGIVAMFCGAVFRLAILPELRTKTCAGGVLFLAYYALFLLLLGWIAPGYIHRVWLAGIPGGTAFGLPRAELLFALSFGMFWSGIYEQFCWTFDLRPPRPASRRQTEGLLPGHSP